MSRTFPALFGAMLAACGADPAEVELRQHAVVACWPEQALIFVGDSRDGSVRAISTRNHTPVVLWQRWLAEASGVLRIELDTQQQRLVVGNERKVCFQDTENGAFECATQ